MSNPQASHLPDSPLQGEFWVPGSRRPHREGTLQVTAGGYRLQLEGLITPSAQIHGPATDGSIRIDHGAAKPTVRDYRAREVFGELCDRTAVTLLDAHMQLGIPLFSEPRQEFDGHRILRGAHLRADGPVHGVRWQVALESAAWADDDPVETVLGPLAPWSGQTHPGLSLHFNAPISLEVAAEEVTMRTSSLLSVARGDRVPVLDRQILTADGTWCPYGVHKPADSIALRNLLAGADFNLGAIARWIEQSPRLEHIPYVAAVGTDIVLELHVFAILAALEGLHRRLHPETTRLPGVRRGALERAAKAAATAAAKSLQADGVLADPADDDATMSCENVRRHYRSALGHVDEPTLADRLRELLRPVTASAPDLFQPTIDAWLNTAVKLRNNEGHALSGMKQFSDEGTHTYVGMRISAQWALRLRLLQLVLRPEEIARALHASSRFDMALANIADLLGEDGQGSGRP